MNDYGITTCSKHNYSGTSVVCPYCEAEGQQRIAAERDRYKAEVEQLQKERFDGVIDFGDCLDVVGLQIQCDQYKSELNDLIIVFKTFYQAYMDSGRFDCPICGATDECKTWCIMPTVAKYAALNKIKEG
jgi:hypothetical protein